MKTVATLIAALELLVCAGCGQSPMRQTQYATEETTEQMHGENKEEKDRELTREEYEAIFLMCEQESDFAGMNAAALKMGKTEEFDDTHGGVLHTYEYAAGEKSGKVYILKLTGYTKNEAEKIADRQSVGENDFTVIDYRDLSDPDLQVRNSYRTNSPGVIKAVLQALVRYENDFPSKWKRSEETMFAEWYAHNAAYAAGYDRERTQHVDLNNNDEAIYKQG